MCTPLCRKQLYAAAETAPRGESRVLRKDAVAKTIAYMAICRLAPVLLPRSVSTRGWRDSPSLFFGSMGVRCTFVRVWKAAAVGDEGPSLSWSDIGTTTGAVVNASMVGANTGAFGKAEERAVLQCFLGVRAHSSSRNGIPVNRKVVDEAEVPTGGLGKMCR